MKSNKTGSHLAPSERGAAPVNTARQPQRQDTDAAPKRSRNGRSGGKKGLIALGIVVGVVVLLLLALYFVFLHFYSSMNIRRGTASLSEPYSVSMNELAYEESEIEGESVVLSEEEQRLLDEALAARAEAGVEFPHDGNVYNILLLGNDTRGSGVNERTDAMILVSINKDTKEIIMSSFLRDIYIYIPGWGSNRLNAANVFGGPELTVETIERNFGVDIHNYAEVNFYAFIDIIDILGGVDVELSNAEISEMNKKMQEVNYYSNNDTYDHNIDGGPGSYHLNGDQTLAYCRVRYADSDFGRTERQRIVLEQLWDKAKDMSLIDATSILNQVLPQVTTDLSQMDCLNLLISALQMLSYETTSLHIPADGAYYLTMINEMSVLSIDMEENTQILQSAIYGE